MAHAKFPRQLQFNGAEPHGPLTRFDWRLNFLCPVTVRQYWGGPKTSMLVAVPLTDGRRAWQALPFVPPRGLYWGR